MGIQHLTGGGRGEEVRREGGDRGHSGEGGMMIEVEKGWSSMGPRRRQGYCKANRMQPGNSASRGRLLTRVKARIKEMHFYPFSLEGKARSTEALRQVEKIFKTKGGS